MVNQRGFNKNHDIFKFIKTFNFILETRLFTFYINNRKNNNINRNKFDKGPIPLQNAFWPFYLFILSEIVRTNIILLAGLRHAVVLAL